MWSNHSTPWWLLMENLLLLSFCVIWGTLSSTAYENSVIIRLSSKHEWLTRISEISTELVSNYYYKLTNTISTECTLFISLKCTYFLDHLLQTISGKGSPDALQTIAPVGWPTTKVLLKSSCTLGLMTTSSSVWLSIRPASFSAMHVYLPSSSRFNMYAIKWPVSSSIFQLLYIWDKGKY